MDAGLFRWINRLANRTRLGVLTAYAKYGIA